MRQFYTLIFALFLSGLGFGQIISQYAETDSGTSPKGIEIWNNTAVTLDFTTNNLVIEKGTNGGTPSTDFTLTSGTLGSGEVIVIGTSDMETVTTGNGSVFFEKAFTFNGDDALVIRYGGTITDVFGTPNSDPGSSWTSGGVDTRNQNIELNFGITTGDIDGWSDPSVRFTTTSTAPSNLPSGIQGFGLPPSAMSTTEVQFSITSASVVEGDGNFNLDIEISDPDGSNDTTLEVVLSSGNAAELAGFVDPTIVTFPAGSSAIQTVVLTINDDGFFEGDETLSFEIQNVAGGNNASIGVNAAFNLTIADNDPDPRVVIYIEDFDEPDNKWNNDIASQLFVDPDSPNQGLFIQPSSANNPNFSGNTAFGQDLAGESGEPTLDPYIFSFETIAVSGFSNMEVSFDYYAIGNEETGFYELFIDGVSDTGGLAVQYFNDPDAGVNGTVTLPIPDGTFIVRLELSGNSNGASDIIEIDNVQIKGEYTGPSFSNGTWTPFAPDLTTNTLDAIVLDGVATFDADVNLSSITVNPGAGLIVDSDAELNANVVNLESNATRFSSFILDGTLTNSFSVFYRRWVNEVGFGVTGGNDLISPPVTGLDFGTLIDDPENSFGPNPEDHIIYNDGGIATTEYAFAPFDNSLPDYLNYAIDNDFNGDLDYFIPLNPETGYRVATAFASVITFVGDVNTADVSNFDFGVFGSDPLSIWNLVGNPYPSYLDAQALLANNTAVLDPSFQAIYGYNDSTDSSATGIWTVINAVQNNTLNIAPGQGFFMASNDAGALQYTTTMRTTTGTDDFIQGRQTNTNAIHHMTLELSKTDAGFITDFYFTEAASLGLDPGYDAGLFGGTAPAFALYSHLVSENQGTPMAIQSLGGTDYNDVVIPLGVHAPQGEQLTFTIAYSDLPAGIEVYLEDNVTNTFTLLNTGDYTLTPNTDLNGTGRFFLHFSSALLSNPETAMDTIEIYTPSDTKSVVIAGHLNAQTTVEMYDLQGRLVLSELLNPNVTEHSLDVRALSSGVYVIKLHNPTLKKTQKVILK